MVNYVPINVLWLVVGSLLLVFGLQWLRKAILRASEYKPLHDEAAIYQQEVATLSKAPGRVHGRRDPVAFAVSFKGVLLEGLEVAMIVISFGVPAGRLGLAVVGAAISALVIGLTGAVLARPLAAVPENLPKLGVGLLLATFGAFWMGEGAGVEWPAADGFVLILLGLFALVTCALIGVLKRGSQQSLQQAGT